VVADGSGVRAKAADRRIIRPDELESLLGVASVGVLQARPSTVVEDEDRRALRELADGLIANGATVVVAVPAIEPLYASTVVERLAAGLKPLRRPWLGALLDLTSIVRGYVQIQMSLSDVYTDVTVHVAREPYGLRAGWAPTTPRRGEGTRWRS
jgi:hypothetical protein